MNRLISAAVLSLAAGAACAQTATMPPQTGTFSGATRGYYFTAPVDFRITGIQALVTTGGTNTFMNWSVIKFDGNTPPPVFSATTNAFQTLGTGFDLPANAYAPCSIDIHAGEVIGIYGNTTATAAATTGLNSYGNGTLGTMILGHMVPLPRSGMQFHLGSTTSPAGMHDVWAEPASVNITRIEFTYAPLTGATCYANCDNSTIAPCLNVNDFTCFLNSYGAGQSYANCDASTIAPVLNVNDFTCFLNTYGAGCGTAGANNCLPRP